MEPCIFGDEQERKAAKVCVRAIPGIAKKVNRTYAVLFGEGNGTAMEEGLIHDVTVMKERVHLLVWLAATAAGTGIAGLVMAVVQAVFGGG